MSRYTKSSIRQRKVVFYVSFYENNRGLNNYMYFLRHCVVSDTFIFSFNLMNFLVVLYSKCSIFDGDVALLKVSASSPSENPTKFFSFLFPV